MRNNKIVTVISILFAIIGLVLGFLQTNWQTLFAKEKPLEVRSTSQVDMVNWEQETDGTYKTTADAQIVISGINSYVERVELAGSFQAMEYNPRIFYTDGTWSRFSNDNVQQPDATQTDTGLTISIGRYVKDLRIDLTDIEGLSFGIDEIKIDPNSTIRYDVVIMIIWAAALWMVSFVFRLRGGIVRQLKSYWATFKKYRYLLKNLISKDITLKYRRSVLGIVWSVLNPLLMMMVITAVFQNIFRIGVENFPIFYLTGSLVFNFVTEATNGSLMSILGGGALIKKVYIPKYIFPLQKCLFAFVNMLFSLIAVVIMFVVLRTEVHWTIVLFPIPLIYALIFSTGLGFILASLNVFFRDLGHLYGVWVTAWMYLTPIIYSIQALPRIMQKVVEINPLYYYVDYFRQVVMYGNVPDFRYNMICIVYALFFLAAGLLIFKKQQDRYILYI